MEEVVVQACENWIMLCNVVDPYYFKWLLLDTPVFHELTFVQVDLSDLE